MGPVGWLRWRIGRSLRRRRRETAAAREVTRLRQQLAWWQRECAQVENDRNRWRDRAKRTELFLQEHQKEGQ